MFINNKKISYIAEINLDSKSAYKHQVLKMCDAFSELGLDVTLHVISKSKTSFTQLKKNHLLKNSFNIQAVFKKNKDLNFLSRLIFFIKIKNRINNSLIYSRSVLCSLFFSLLNKNNFLEIHQENSGLTAFLYNVFKKKIFRYINFILISKNLKKIFLIPNKKKILIAGDGVDIRDFNQYKNKNFKEIKNSCIYTGSLHKGKGFEFIFQLAKKNKNLKFFVYGDVKTAQKKLINQTKKINNLKIMGHVEYSKIPKILRNHPVILMPYDKKVFGNHRSANLADYMSPLKMFDYLASSKVIISSKNENIQKILKNNYNCLICNNLSLVEWSNKIMHSMNNSNLKKILSKNAFTTAKKFTWKGRANKILEFINENI